jgi:hypothetical protein
MDEEQHVLRSFCVHGTDQLFVACTSLQHEMTLVNKADADRDTIDDYMQELDSLHRKQLLLGTSGLSTAHAPAFGILEDDDSFEDLRDD